MFIFNERKRTQRTKRSFSLNGNERKERNGGMWQLNGRAPGCGCNSPGFDSRHPQLGWDRWHGPVTLLLGGQNKEWQSAAASITLQWPRIVLVWQISSRGKWEKLGTVQYSLSRLLPAIARIREARFGPIGTVPSSGGEDDWARSSSSSGGGVKNNQHQTLFSQQGSQSCVIM